MIVIDQAFGLLKNIAGAVQEFFSLQRAKLAQNNTDRMEQAADAQAEVKAVDKTNAAIANKDEAEIRKELAE